MANLIEAHCKEVIKFTQRFASCHSMKYLSYRNLAEKGGPEFSEAEAKAIAASFEVIDGPNTDGEMFTDMVNFRIFVMPYENVEAAKAANGEHIHQTCLF